MVTSSKLRLVTLTLVFAALAGCNKAPVRTDARIASDVQNKISADSRITSHDVGVRAAGRVVTLSGSVGNDVERASAASDAATVEGVKTVVNNLVVQEAQGASVPVAELPSGAPTQAGKKAFHPAPVGAAKNATVLPPVPGDDSSSSQSSKAPTPPTTSAGAQAPAPPPPPKKVTIPAGTQLTIRLNDGLDTERNQVGDSFHATLGAPISIDDETVIPSGADVLGRVVDVKSAGRFAGNSALTLELTSLSVNGKTYNIQTNQWSRQGKGEGKNTAIKAGGGAALGAIIGGIAGGGKGAAIGSAAGAGAGTGAAATKKGEQIKLSPESTLSFLLINTVTVTQQSADNHNAGRAPLP